MTAFRLLFRLALLLGAGALTAQEITTVAEVRALDATDAGREPRPLRLRGVVVEVGLGKSSFTLHDGSHSTGVTLSAGLACPAQGDTVELEGTTRTEEIAGNPHARVLARTLAVTGKAALPAAEPLGLAELNRFNHFDQWVAVEGHVVRWKFRRTDNELVMVVTGADDWTTVAVRTAGRQEVPAGLMGAKVRLTGINAGRVTHTAFGALIVPSPAQLEILRPGNDDPFAVPLVTMKEVADKQVEPGARVRVRGVVLARPEATELYVRGSDGAQCDHLLLPFPRNTDLEEFTDAGPLPPLQPGDEVEVVGSPLPYAWGEFDAPAHSLLFCHVRVTGRQPPPDPVPATLAELAAGKRPHDLVRVRGRLTGISRVAVAKSWWLTTLNLDADGTRMPVHFYDSGGTKLDALKVDDELLVTALAVSSTADHPRELLQLKATDVVSLGLSPVARARRLWLWGGSMSAVMVLLGTWIAALRRSSRRQARTARELKAAGDAARESEQRWQLLFEQSPLSVQIFAPDGRTKRVNRAWMNLFRQTEEEGLAFNVLEDPNLKASGAVELIRQAFTGEVVHVPPVPFPVGTAPPEYRWIGGVLYPVTSQSGEIIEVVTVHNDITEMKRAEEAMLALNHTLEHRVEERTAELSQAQTELSRALAQERELGELKSRFVYTVSHEFRTPLGVIMSAVELLQHYSERLPREEKDFQMAEIRGATEHMGKLMEQVLLLGRVEAGKLACNLRQLDLFSLTDRIIDESRSSTGGKCRVTLHAAQGFEHTQGDEGLLRHILGNLIGNAIKYSPDEGEVVVDLRRDEQDAVIEIRDQGIGIPEADHPRLFEAFHRGANVGETCGTGLGLAIVKHCVGLHGGDIGFRSAPGAGTTFTVRLPLFPISP